MTERRPPALAVVLASALSSSCVGSSHRLSLAQTPDRRHRVEVVEEYKRQGLLIDGKPGVRFEAIAPASLEFSPDGSHVAYAVKVNARWSLALDHCPGLSHDGIGDIAFSPNGRRLAYAALGARAWRVVTDGSSGPAVSSLFAGTLTFSPDSRRLAYVAASAEGVRVFLDGVAGPVVDAVAQLQFDGAGRLYYVARQKGASFVVVDGVPQPSYQSIGQLVVDPSGVVAYTAQQATGWFVVSSGSVVGGPYPSIELDSLSLDSLRGTPSFIIRNAEGKFVPVLGGQLGPAFDEMGSLAFSADGRHVGYRARRGADVVLSIDGRERTVPARPSDPVFSPTGDRVAYTLAKKPPSVVVDDREHNFASVVEDTLVFSRDGQHWALLVGDPRSRSLFFALDGRVGAPFDFAELVSLAASASDRGVQLQSEAAILKSWARAVANSASETATPAPRWLSGRCERAKKQ